MQSNRFFCFALALLASAIPSVAGQYNPNCAYFVQYTGGYLVTERVDPLLSPGVASNHVHSITGGNGFKANMTFADTQASTCTTAEVTQDKTNYWMPVLYFNNNGKFYKVPEANNRKIYYKYGNGDCSADTSRSEFPQGFRMMTGSATQRELNQTMMGVAGNQLEWKCHDGASNPTATGFPTGFQSCNDQYVKGLAASMRFPSCWNGNDFDIDNPLAHMAFPTNADGMAGCPAPFNKARFPEIFIEYYFDISSFDHITKDYSNPNNPPWVLADGDPTGYSMHMDFFNGWKPGALQKAMKTCAIADGGSDATKKTGLASDACFGVASPGTDGYQTSETMDKCTLGQIVSPAEDVGLAAGTALSALPGCNPIQSSQPATIHPPSSCGAATEVLGGSAPPPAGSANAASYSTATSAAATSTPSDQSVTSSAPALEKVATSSSPTSPSEAAAPTSPSTSSGTSSGASPSSITVKNTLGSSETWVYQGCYTDLAPDRNTRSLANWGSGQSSSDCANNCFSAGYSIAGTEYGAQCFCGKIMTSTTKRSDSECNQACKGDSTETCGGASRLSVYAKAGATLTKRSSHLHRHVVRNAGS